MAQGGKRLLLGDQVFEYRAGQCLVVTADLPVTGHFLDAGPRTPALGDGADAAPGRHRRAAAGGAGRTVGAQAGRPARDHDRRGRPGAAGRRGPAAAAARSSRGRAGAGPADRAGDPVAAAHRPARPRWSARSAWPTAACPTSSRAIRWIRDNYAEPMRIADLARLAGMSPSAFHRHFRAVTAMSPLQFQKRIRLQEARSLLVAGPGDVAGVGPPGRLRQPVAVQPRVPADVRRVPRQGCGEAARERGRDGA